MPTSMRQLYLSNYKVNIDVPASYTDNEVEEAIRRNKALIQSTSPIFLQTKKYLHDALISNTSQFPGATITEDQARNIGINPAMNAALEAQQYTTQDEAALLRHYAAVRAINSANQHVNASRIAQLAQPHLLPVERLTATAEKAANELGAALNTPLLYHLLDYGAPGASQQLDRMRGYGAGLARGILGFSSPVALGTVATLGPAAAAPLGTPLLLGTFGVPALREAYQRVAAGDWGGALGELTAFGLPFVADGLKMLDNAQNAASYRSGARWIDENFGVDATPAQQTQMSSTLLPDHGISELHTSQGDVYVRPDTIHETDQTIPLSLSKRVQARDVADAIDDSNADYSQKIEQVDSPLARSDQRSEDFDREGYAYNASPGFGSQEENNSTINMALLKNGILPSDSLMPYRLEATTTSPSMLPTNSTLIHPDIQSLPGGVGSPLLPAIVKNLRIAKGHPQSPFTLTEPQQVDWVRLSENKPLLNAQEMYSNQNLIRYINNKINNNISKFNTNGQLSPENSLAFPNERVAPFIPLLNDVGRILGQSGPDTMAGRLSNHPVSAGVTVKFPTYDNLKSNTDVAREEEAGDLLEGSYNQEVGSNEKAKERPPLRPAISQTLADGHLSKPWYRRYLKYAIGKRYYDRTRLQTVLQGETLIRARQYFKKYPSILHSPVVLRDHLTDRQYGTILPDDVSPSGWQIAINGRLIHDPEDIIFIIVEEAAHIAQHMEGMEFDYSAPYAQRYHEIQAKEVARLITGYPHGENYSKVLTRESPFMDNQP